MSSIRLEMKNYLGCYIAISATSIVLISGLLYTTFTYNIVSTEMKPKTTAPRFYNSNIVSSRTTLHSKQVVPKGPIFYNGNIVSSRATWHSKQVVPKIVHYIWFYSKRNCSLRFHQHISILSAFKYIKPVTIIFWNENLPCGKWWDETKARIPILQTRHMLAPTAIFGKKINVPEHRTDIARLDILMEYGGIYLDTDMVALKSWDSLLHYSITLGAETDYDLANGAIITTKTAKFLPFWKEAYHDFKAKEWGYNSVIMPFRLARAHPELIHIEWNTLMRPMWEETEWLFEPGMLWNWIGNYGMHLYYRYHEIDHNPEDIKKMNSTLGQVFCLIYYNTTELID